MSTNLDGRKPFLTMNEQARTAHDVACELASLWDDMEKMRGNLFNVGLGSLASSIGAWQDRIKRAQMWSWPHGDPRDVR